MPDCAYASIELGGRIPKAAIDELEAAATNDGAYLEDDDYSKLSLADALALAAAREDTISLVNEEASWGELDEIISICEQFGIPYRHANTERYEISNVVKYFDGEGASETINATSGDLDPCVTVSTLGEALRAGETLAAVYAKYAKFIEPLPPIIVTDDEE